MKKVENQIANIHSVLNRLYADKHDVVIDRPRRGSSCLGIIKIYNRTDNATRRNPLTTYAFYPQICNSHALGSVAIYDADITPIYEQLQKFGHLFGYSIRKMSIKMGRRPFIDVDLAA